MSVILLYLLVAVPQGPVRSERSLQQIVGSSQAFKCHTFNYTIYLKGCKKAIHTAGRAGDSGLQTPGGCSLFSFCRLCIALNAAHM